MEVSFRKLNANIHHDTSKTTKRMAQFSTRSWSIRKLSGKHVILAIVGLIVVYMLLRPQPRSTPSVQDVLEDNHQSVNPDVPAYSHPNPTLEIIPFHVKKQAELRQILPEEIAEWILTYRHSYRLVVLEPAHLQCLLERNAGGSCQKAHGLNTIRFALMAENSTDVESVAALLHQIANQKSDWTFEKEKSSKNAITLSQSDVKMFITTLEERKNYWYIHGSESSTMKEPARMFMRLNFAQLVIGDRKEADLFAPYPVSEYVWQWEKSKFLDCDRRKDSVTLTEASMVDILAHYRDILDNMRMTLMLTDASALGWYRECDLTLDSSRVDLAFLATEWNPELIETLKTDTILKFEQVSGEPEDALAITVHAGNVPIYLHALYENKNATHAKRAKEAGNQLRFWHPPKKGVCATDLRGQLFYVRCDMLCSIVGIYGPKWRETKDLKEYNWAQATAEEKAATKCWRTIALLHGR